MRQVFQIGPQAPSAEAAGASGSQQASAGLTQAIVAGPSAQALSALHKDVLEGQAPKSGYGPQATSKKSLRAWLNGLRERKPRGGKQAIMALVAQPLSKTQQQKIAGFQLPPAHGPTMLMQAVASALACAAKPLPLAHTQSPSNFFDAGLVALLLWRDTPKAESFDDLSAAPVERALESILADEVITQMPAALIAPIAELGRVSAELLEQAAPGRRLAWTRALCNELKKEYPRPWSCKTPITSLLCEEELCDQQKTDAVVQFLRQRPSDGFQTLAAMTILRALYLGAERLGMATQTVPFISCATNFYVSNMLDLTGRIYVQWGRERPKHQGVGLTAYGEPSPIDACWMQPALISSHLYRPNPKANGVLQDLAYGNPYGVGISGSTNIFLFAAGHFNRIGAANIDLLALTTAMAAMLCYNGGHGFNEVYSAAKMYPDAATTQLTLLQDYHPGHARGTFVAQADPQQSWLATSSFRRLAQFLLETNASRPV